MRKPVEKITIDRQEGRLAKDLENSRKKSLPTTQKEEAAYSDDGVDLTLIRWMLSLTPSERLQVLQQNVQSLARLCNESSFT